MDEKAGAINLWMWVHEGKVTRDNGKKCLGTAR
jgi:hypothetical protein